MDQLKSVLLENKNDKKLTEVPKTLKDVPDIGYKSKRKHKRKQVFSIKKLRSNKRVELHDDINTVTEVIDHCYYKTIENQENQTCRTCMAESGKMTSLYTTQQFNGVSTKLSDMLMACASVLIDNDDGLPFSMCDSCIKQLKSSYKFKHLCETSDAILRNNLDKQTINNISNTKVKTETLDENDSDGIYDTETLDPLDSLTDNQQENTENNKKLNVKYNATNYEPEYMISTSDIINRTHACSICTKTFASKRYLNQHKRHHFKIYNCKLCEKTFKSSHGLMYHTKRHNNVKDYVCPIETCRKRFIIKQSLNKHLSLHSNEKTYLCSECGKAYYSYDAMSYHMKQHLGTRPHLCIHCGKTFIQACHLKAHMWIHNGIKPYFCHSCGNRYTSGHQLKKHMRRHCGKTEQTTEPYSPEEPLEDAGD